MKIEKEQEYEFSLSWGRFANIPISILDTQYLERIYREASQTVYFVGPELERRKANAKEE
jgi:hypothetical protein